MKNLEKKNEASAYACRSDQLRLSECSAFKIDYLLALYITAIVCAELLGSKMITILGVPTSIGVFVIPITFTINDIVFEVVGKERARNFVRSGLYILIFLFAFTYFARELPPAKFYITNDAYRTVFGNSLRVIIASLIAFAIGELTDIYIFSKIKERLQKTGLWFRNNVSNIIGLFIDTTIFIFVAFYLVTPSYDFMKMVAIIIPYWLLKILFSVCGTPLTYLGVRWLRKD